MLLRIHSRALLRGMLAGAIAIGSVSACSRDRADAGRDTEVGETNTAGTPSDTTAAGYQPMARDTSVTLAQGDTTRIAAKDQPDTVTVVGDSSSVDKPGPRAKEDTLAQKADSLAQHHEADRIRPPEDSTETLGQVTTDSAGIAAADTAAGPIPDTAAAGYEPMARDTSVALAQEDTLGQAEPPDTSVQAEADTAAIQVQVDTSTEAQTELAVEDQGDSVTVVGDSSSVDQPGPRAKEDTVFQKADSLAQYHEAERVRPPEDSAEVLGNVNTDRPEAKADAAEADVEGVGDANAEAVGTAQVQPTGNIATGAAAVSLMTRGGQRCTVVDLEESPDARWDLASSPASVNPCGTGTMTLPRIWTGEKE